MAERTGAALKQMLSGNEANVKIISSPFSRCLETAQRIASHFHGVDRIDVDYQCSEFLNASWYQVDPFPELMILNSEAFKESMTLPLNFVPGQKPVFPENWSGMTARYHSHTSAIATELLSPQCNVIVVTHGYYADIFCEQFGEYPVTAPYCAISSAVQEGASLRLILAKSSEHVQDLYS